MNDDPKKECSTCHQMVPAWEIYEFECMACRDKGTQAANSFWPEMERWLNDETNNVDKKTRGRLRNFLTYTRIGDVEALCATSARELLKYRNIGRATVAAIEAWLGSKGLHLRPESTTYDIGVLRARVAMLERQLADARALIAQRLGIDMSDDAIEAHKVRAEDTPS